MSCVKEVQRNLMMICRYFLANDTCLVCNNRKCYYNVNNFAAKNNNNKITDSFCHFFYKIEKDKILRFYPEISISLVDNSI